MTARPADEPLEFTLEEMHAAETAHSTWRQGRGPRPSAGQYAARAAYLRLRRAIRRARSQRQWQPRRIPYPIPLRPAPPELQIHRHPDVDRCPRCGAWRWAGTCSTPHEMGRSEVRTVTEPGRSVAVGQHDGPGASTPRPPATRSDSSGRGQA